MHLVVNELKRIFNIIQHCLAYWTGMVEYSVCAESPIEANDSLTVRANVVILKNAGSAQVTVDDNWTLRQGESMQLGDSSGPRGVISHTFKVRFASTGTKRLEVLTMSGTHQYSTANYVDQPK